MIHNPAITFLEIVLTRYLCIFLFNFPIMWLKEERPWNIERKNLKILLNTFFLVLLIWLLMSYSLKDLPVGLVIVIQNSSPVFTAIFEYLISGVSLSCKEITNLLFSYSGVVMICCASNQDKDQKKELVIQAQFMLALALCVTSTIIGSLIPIMITRIRKVHFAV